MTDLSSGGIWVVAGKKLNVRTVSRPVLGGGGAVAQAYSVILRSPGNYSTTARLNFSRSKVKGPNTRSAFGGGTVLNRGTLKAGARSRGQLRGKRTALGAGFGRSMPRTIV